GGGPGGRGRAGPGGGGRRAPTSPQLRPLPRLHRYDVVFLTGSWPLLLAARAIPARRRPRLVWLNMTLTNLLRRPHPLTGLLRLAVHGADRVVCVARHQQAFLRRLFDWPEGRLPLALSGTDATFYDPARARGTLPLQRADAGPRGGPTSRVPGPGSQVTAPPGAPAGRTILAPGRDAGRDYA